MLPHIIIFTLVNFIVRKRERYIPFLLLYGLFSISFLEDTFGQSNSELYLRLSITVGIENIYGFEMEQLPYNLIYRHENQIGKSLSINYDVHRNNFVTLRFGLRTILIIENEYVFFSKEYSEIPYDINYYITTNTGFGDLRYEFLSQYEYRFLTSKNSSLFIGVAGILGYEPNTHFSILETGNEYNGFESYLIASHKNPNSLYGKLGAGAGINLYTDWLLLRLNFYYHYRLQNFLEGKLIIDNSNNERIERNYVLKGDSYGIGVSVFPRRSRKKNN